MFRIRLCYSEKKKNPHFNQTSQSRQSWNQVCWEQATHTECATASVLEPVTWLTCVCAQSRLTVCDPMDCSYRGSPVHGIFQAKIQEWVASFFSRGSSWPKDRTHISWISCIGRRILQHSATQEATVAHRPVLTPRCTLQEHLILRRIWLTRWETSLSRALEKCVCWKHVNLIWNW